jgi:hypothetical protein
MFLPRLPAEPEKPKIPLESPRYVQAATYGFWFCTGITIAHVVRLTGTWILYVPALFAARHLMLLRPANATDSEVSLQRISGLSLILGLVLALWDAIALVARSPIVLPWWLFNLVLPLWLLLLGVALLIILTIVNKD